MADPIVWPVIFGAVAALTGVALTSATNLAIKLADTRIERRKRRAEKFETLVETVYEFDHWLDVHRGVTAFGNQGEITLSPLAKVEAIAAVHFPQFSTPVGALGHAALGYQSWMFEAAQKRLDGKIAEIRDGWRDAYRPYSEARNVLLEELKKFAAKGL